MSYQPLRLAGSFQSNAYHAVPEVAIRLLPVPRSVCGIPKDAGSARIWDKEPGRVVSCPKCRAILNKKEAK